MIPSILSLAFTAYLYGSLHLSDCVQPKEVRVRTRSRRLSERLDSCRSFLPE